MQDNKPRLEALFDKWLDRRCSPEEVAELIELLTGRDDASGLTPRMAELWEQVSAQQVKYPVDWDKHFTEITRLPRSVVKAKPTRRIYRVVAAAAAIAVLLVGWAFWHRPAVPSPPEAASKIVSASGIHPGSIKAVLTLANGDTITLNRAGSGEVAKQGATSIVKLDSGLLAYRQTGASAGKEQFNTLATPVGGQYELRLPDGTRVWLNAASSIRYPTAFTGARRQVLVSGEAYFEVAPDPGKPFLVAAEGLEIQVLGTRFNLNAYGDESTVNTTLVEGSVRVRSLKGSRESLVIAPGQQARLDGQGKITLVRNADTKEALGWKNGLFVFHNDDLPEIMRQLARWYDVEVQYAGGRVPRSHFSGAVYRKEDIGKVLHMLELAGGAHFRVEGTTIIVSP
jgi:ferric-dicitrate binding protein FerR (iron transport regulator)